MRARTHGHMGLGNEYEKDDMLHLLDTAIDIFFSEREKSLDVLDLFRVAAVYRWRISFVP